jgi:hypothetical protein
VIVDVLVDVDVIVDLDGDGDGDVAVDDPLLDAGQGGARRAIEGKWAK